MTDSWALGVSVAALLVAAGTGWYNRASARSARRSEVIAEEARDAATKVACAELERDHRELRPQPTDVFKMEGDGQQPPELTYMFTLPRTYRMHGDLVFRDGRREPLIVDRGTIVEGGVEHRAFVAQMVGQPQLPDLVGMRFFPAHADDPGEPWTCPCGRPVLPEDQDSRGHWVLNRKVERPPKPPPRFV